MRQDLQSYQKIMCKKAISLTFLSVWRESSLPFPVLSGAENNMVDFSLKENDSF